MDYKSILKKILIPNKKGIDHNKLNKILYNQQKYNNVFNFLLNIYNDSYSIEETLKRLILNIDQKPLCPICGKPVNFIGKQSKMFSKYCSNSCRAKEKENIKKWIDGQKKYNIKNHGVEYNWQRNDCKEKRKQSLIEHYGTDKLYTIKEIKEKIDKSINNKIQDIINHRNETLKEKYGILNVGGLTSLPEIQEKINKTKRKNQSFNTSNQEDQSYLLIKEKYNDVKRQYRSELYPFNCDFYIPSLNLYIECNFHWTHNNHQYNKNELKDQIILQQWKSKNTQYYRNAINIWTNLDVRKRNIAKKNNLNFIEFWNLNELKEWLNKKEET